MLANCHAYLISCLQITTHAWSHDCKLPRMPDLTLANYHTCLISRKLPHMPDLTLANCHACLISCLQIAMCAWSHDWKLPRVPDHMLANRHACLMPCWRTLPRWRTLPLWHTPKMNPKWTQTSTQSNHWPCIFSRISIYHEQASVSEIKFSFTNIRHQIHTWYSCRSIIFTPLWCEIVSSKRWYHCVRHIMSMFHDLWAISCDEAICFHFEETLKRVY